MTPDEFNQFSDMWSAAWEAAGRSITGAAIEIAYEALRHYELGDIQQALNSHIRNPDTGQYTPKPADVVRFIEGDTRTRAAKAWAKLDRAIRTVGPYRSVRFDDHLIHVAVEQLGGWTKVCEVSDDEAPFLRNRFEQIYRGVAVTPPTQYPARLIGYTEIHNAAENQGHRETATVGNPELAARVEQLGHEGSTVPVSLKSLMGDSPTGKSDRLHGEAPIAKDQKVLSSGSQN